MKIHWNRFNISFTRKRYSSFSETPSIICLTRYSSCSFVCFVKYMCLTQFSLAVLRRQWSRLSFVYGSKRYEERRAWSWQLDNSWLMKSRRSSRAPLQTFRFNRRHFLLTKLTKFVKQSPWIQYWLSCLGYVVKELMGRAKTKKKDFPHSW